MNCIRTKNYYKLSEAAEKLNTDVQAIIDYFLEHKCQLCILFLSDLKSSNINIYNRDIELEQDFSIASNKAYPIIHSDFHKRPDISSMQDDDPVHFLNYFYHIINDGKNFVTKDFVDVKKTSDGLYIDAELDEASVTDESSKSLYWSRVLVYFGVLQLTDIVITDRELNRLLNKPTYEQLADENKSLRKQIDALTNANSAKIQEKRELVLSYWVEGKGQENIENLTKDQIHQELKKIKGSLFHFEDFDTFWKNQQIIKLKHGARKQG